MPQFFFEIYQEEIPARMQKPAKDQLEKLLGEILNNLQIQYDTVRTMVTPLRLIGCVDGIANASKEIITRVRGPKEGMDAAIDKFKMTHAGANFMVSDGYIYAEKITQPSDTMQLIPSVMENMLQKFNWAKTMRWPGSQVEWIRPIRRVYCNFDQRPLIFNLPSIGVETSDHVTGHRFMSTDHLQPVDFDNYIELLMQNYVMADFQKRCNSIREQLSFHGDYLVDEALVEENAGLTEWPIVYTGAIEERFMALPPEVLTTTMKVHQRYFTFSGKPIFGVVANAQPEDCGAMVAGYERVLRARLSDAQFFYQQDCTKTLEDFLPKLETIVFHKNIGTLADKSRRLEEFMDTPDGKIAARLCKADLVSSVVYEFPELQGVMGRIYAKRQGLADDIGTAIQQHYWPTGADQPLPTCLLSAQLAFADKLDTLLGLISTGVQVSSSKDPLGLRRCALGIIRLIVQFGFDFDAALARCHPGAAQQNQGSYAVIIQFLKDRALVYFKDQGFADDILKGLMHLPITTMIQRIPVVTEFVASTPGQEFLVQYKRLCGLIKPHEGGEIIPEYPFEVTLQKWVEQNKDFTDPKALLPLIEGMQNYFDTVKVLDGTPVQVANRLMLLGVFKSVVDKFCILTQ